MKKIITLFLITCLIGSVSHADSMITAKDAFVRVVPGNNALAAGFVTLHNGTKKPVALTAARSPVIGRI